MATCLLATVLIVLLSSFQASAQNPTQDTLPDNHLPFTLHKVDNKLSGESEYLAGFGIMIILSEDALHAGLDSAGLLSLARDGTITGVLTYPNGKSTASGF